MSRKTTEIWKWWNIYNSSGFCFANGLPHISFLVKHGLCNYNPTPNQLKIRLQLKRHNTKWAKFNILFGRWWCFYSNYLLCLCSFLMVTSCTWCITLLYLKCSAQERWKQNKINDNIQSKKHHFPVQMLRYLFNCLAWCIVYDAGWMAHFLKCFFWCALCIAHVNKCKFFHLKHFHIRILFEMFALALLRFVYSVLTFIIIIFFFRCISFLLPPFHSWNIIKKVSH